MTALRPAHREHMRLNVARASGVGTEWTVDFVQECEIRAHDSYEVSVGSGGSGRTLKGRHPATAEGWQAALGQVLAETYAEIKAEEDSPAHL